MNLVVLLSHGRLRLREMILLALVLCSAPMAMGRAQQQEAPPPSLEVPESVRFIPDVMFRVHGSETLRLDLFLPRGEGRRPAIVYVGEGDGSRRSEQLWPLAGHLATLGFAGAVIDYRPRAVGPRIPIAGSVSDAKLAVRWLRAHAEEYGIDRARIGLVGASRGAVVAALAGLPQWFGVGSNDNVRFPAEVGAVALIEPLLDFADAALSAPAQRFLEEVLGTSAVSDSALRARISPANYFAGGATSDVREHTPPFLFLHGTHDDYFPFRHSDVMAQELRKNGILAEVFTARDAGHGFWQAPEWRARTLDAVAGFFQRTLAEKFHAGWVDSQPAWSPDGSHIAFDSGFGGELQVWVMKADGSDLRSLAAGNNPAWSSDGKRLVFADAGRLSAINADGSGLVQLTNDATEFVYSPSWSPDGRHIAYSSWVDNQLYLIRVADGHVTRLTDTAGGNGCSSWSPDSSKIIFHSGRDGQSELYSISLDGSATTRLTDSPTNEFCPRMSPDGRKIAFQRRAANVHQHIDIFVMDADGSSEVNLTDHFANDRWASWSPDGSWLAFASTRGGNHDIYVIRADGKELRRLTHR